MRSISTSGVRPRSRKGVQVEALVFLGAVRKPLHPIVVVLAAMSGVAASAVYSNIKVMFEIERSVKGLPIKDCESQIALCARRYLKTPETEGRLPVRIVANVGGTMLGATIYASRSIDGVVLRAEFHRDTGRLRILEGEVTLVERCPPHAWLEIASVAGYSTSGPRPSEKDLGLLLDEFQSRRAGVRRSG